VPSSTSSGEATSKKMEWVQITILNDKDIQ
jgi:hypothetical protein